MATSLQDYLDIEMRIQQTTEDIGTAPQMVHKARRWIPSNKQGLEETTGLVCHVEPIQDAFELKIPNQLLVHIDMFSERAVNECLWEKLFTRCRDSASCTCAIVFRNGSIIRKAES